MNFFRWEKIKSMVWISFLPQNHAWAWWKALKDCYLVISNIWKIVCVHAIINKRNLRKPLDRMKAIFIFIYTIYIAIKFLSLSFSLPLIYKSRIADIILCDSFMQDNLRNPALIIVLQYLASSAAFIASSQFFHSSHFFPTFVFLW